MSDVIEVQNVGEWPCPFRVRISGEESEFSTAAEAQEFALAKHDTLGLELVYLDDMQFPLNSGNRITSRLAMFSIESAGRICAKCRVRKPLDAFDGHYHRNKTYGREVFHGWHDRCRDCGGDGW